MKPVVAFFLMVLGVACSETKSPQTSILNKFSDSEIQAIYEFRDQRDTPALLPFLNHNRSELRAEAALAIGSVQDSNAANALIALLEDSVHQVRQNAAFALGQLYDSTLQAPLRTAINQEQSGPVIKELLEALGKCSDQGTLDFICAYQGSELGQAWGLYRCGLRGFKNEQAINTAINLLSSNDSEARLGAAHYLARTRDLDLSAYHQQISPLVNQQPVTEVRMALATALGKVGSAAEEHLLELLSDDDYRVQVNALRALAQLPALDQWDEVNNALSHENMQVALTAGQVFAKHADDAAIASKTGHSYPARVQANLQGIAFSRGIGHVDILLNQVLTTDNPYHQAYWIQALSNSVKGIPALTYLGSEDLAPVARTALANAFFSINQLTEFPEKERNNFLDTYKTFMASGDVATMGIAAQALRNPDLGYKSLISDYAFLEQAMAKLSLPQEIETYQELHATLNYLTDSNEPMAMAGQGSGYVIDWDYLKTIPAVQPVSLETTKGNITIDFYPEQSPGTVSYILKLMDSGYYQNKTIHRVVPNFVAQGGCPRGDGWGSTPQTIRSEFGLTRYTTGSVGMASAGKDTESCQWFITHSPTPHLDGRYTIFAEVTSGMEVVNQLEPGDKILSMEKVLAE